MDDFDTSTYSTLMPITSSYGHDDRLDRFRRIRAAIILSRCPEGFRLSIERCAKDGVGLAVRWPQVRRYLKSALRPHALLQWEDQYSAVVRPIELLLPANCLTEVIAQLLLKLAEWPLTPRLLLTALPITTKERLRWTKDGRLKQTGNVTINRGQLISVPTYSVSLVERLLNDPAIIGKWRAQDAQM